MKRFLTSLLLAGAILGPTLPGAQAAPSVGTVDFNLSNGDFTVVNTNNPPNPWRWDSARGTWASSDTADCATARRSSRLNSPAWTVVSAGTVTVSFSHRHSFESDTTRWDGGQLRLSVNGGAYTTVPGANFTANGYTDTIGGAAVPGSEIAGEFAFTGDSAGYAEGVFVTSTATLGTFAAGTTLSIQFLGAWDDCAQAQVPNWEIDSIQFTPALEDRRPPPSFTNAALPADTTVPEGTSYTLQVAVTGATSLQWFFNGAPIDGATGTNYTIASMSNADAGEYFVEASNAIGTVRSRTATIAFTTDSTPPRMIAALADGTDLTRFTLLVNEPLCTDEVTCGSDADDQFNYLIVSLDGSEVIDVATATITDGTNVTLVTVAPRTPGRGYQITLDFGLSIGDRFRNTIPLNTPDSKINILEPVVFQQGLNGYTGTQDTELRGAAAGVVQGNAVFVTVDAADGGGVSQGLLRFDNLFGPNPGQVPPGSTILSAKLTLSHGNGATPDGDLVNVHRMLIPWDESTATYASLVTGVSANDIEARSTADFAIVSTGLVQGGKLTFNVVTSLQAWSNGEANHGWAMIPTAGNGYRWDTSESTVANSQPKLEVLYTVPPCSPLSITQQPVASTTVNEGQGFTLSVTVLSQGCAPRFQWTRNGEDIAGATGPSYTVTAANPTIHGGAYRVRVVNDAPSTATSSAAQVTVIADTVKPTVVAAIVESDLAGLTITFSEAVSATADNPARYSITPASGGAALAFTLSRSGPATIRLATASLTLGTTYNLAISGITDTASTPNQMDPVTIPVTARSRRLLASDAVWKFDQTGNYDATLAPGATPWHSPAFDDSAWSSGPGLFGLESAAVIASLSFPSPQIRTAWTIGAAQITYYLRTSLTVPAAPADAIVVLRHATDDGMVAYLNGAEAARFNITNAQPVLHDHLAPAASPEGVVLCTRLNAPAGTHTLAVEVHQSSATSSDVVFGAEIFQLIPPALKVTHQAGGGAVVTWDNDPAWYLVSSTSVTGPYTAVAGNPTSPYSAAPATGNVFYQLQCR